MRIKEVETFNLVAPLDEPFGWSQGWTEARYTLLVKITTDDGLEGWGETLCTEAEYIVTNTLAPLIIGEDPMNRIRVWERMHRCFYPGNVTVGFA